MFPNLIGLKAIHRLTNQDMADIMHSNRTTYESKMRTGNFNVRECKAFSEYFNRPFEFLFSTSEDQRTQ